MIWFFFFLQESGSSASAAAVSRSSSSSNRLIIVEAKEYKEGPQEENERSASVEQLMGEVVAAVADGREILLPQPPESKEIYRSLTNLRLRFQVQQLLAAYVKEPESLDEADALDKTAAVSNIRL